MGVNILLVGEAFERHELAVFDTIETVAGSGVSMDRGDTPDQIATFLSTLHEYDALIIKPDFAMRRAETPYSRNEIVDRFRGSNIPVILVAETDFALHPARTLICDYSRGQVVPLNALVTGERFHPFGRQLLA